MSSNIFSAQGYVPPNTIVPQDWSLFIPYFNRLYEDVAYAVNNRDFIFYPMAITSTAQNIQNVPLFGAFIICVSGVNQGLPCLTASLCKSSKNIAGSITPIGSQAGNIAPWVAATLTITSTATNFQIQHSLSGVTGSFNIRIIATQ